MDKPTSNTEWFIYLSTSIRLTPLKIVYRIVLIVFQPRSACAYLYTILCVSRNNKNVIVS